MMIIVNADINGKYPIVLLFLSINCSKISATIHDLGA